MFFSVGFFLFSNFFQLILIKEKLFLENFFLIFKTKICITEKKKISSKILILFFSTQKSFVLNIKNQVGKKGLKKIKRSIFHKKNSSNENEYFTEIKKKILNTRIKSPPSYKYFLFLYLKSIFHQNIIIKEMLFGINEDIYENNSKYLENGRKNYLGWNRLRIEILNQFVYNLKKFYFLIQFTKIPEFYQDKSPKKIIFNLFPVFLPLYGFTKKKKVVSTIKKLISDKTYFGFINIINEKTRTSICKKLYYQKLSLNSKKNRPLLFKNKLTFLKYLKRATDANSIQFKHFIRKNQETKKNFLFFIFIHKSFFQIKIYLFEPKMNRKNLFFLLQKIYFSKNIYKILNRGIITLICFTVLKFGKILFFFEALFYEFLQNFDRFQHKNIISQLKGNLFVDKWKNIFISYFLGSFPPPIKKLFFTIKVRKNVLKHPKNFYVFCKKIINKIFLILYAFIKGFIAFSFFKFYRSFDRITWINISKISKNSYSKFNFFTFLRYMVEKFIKTWNKCTVMNFRGNLFSFHSGRKKLIFVFRILLKLQKISYGDLNKEKKKSFISGYFFHIKSLILNLFTPSQENFFKIDSAEKSKLYFLDFFLYSSFIKNNLLYKKRKKETRPKNLIIIKNLFKYRNPWKKVKKKKSFLVFIINAKFF